MATLTFSLLLAVAVSAAAGETVRLVGQYGGNITLSCDLPLGAEPQVAWKDAVWNMDHNKALIYNSSLADLVNQEHLNKDKMKVSGKTKLTLFGLLSGDEDGNEYEVSSSGDYFCYSLVDGNWLEKHFELSLVDKPMCSGVNELQEGDGTTLTCSIPFSITEPTLEWYRDGKKVDSKFSSEIETAESSVDVKAVTYMDDQSIYTCRMTAGPLTDECQVKIDVKYKVRDIQLSPSDDVLHPGDKITCSARGNPKPELTLSPGNSKTENDGSLSIRVMQAWMHNLVTVKCSASNTVDNSVEIIEKSTFFNVTKKVEKADPVMGGGASTTVSSTALVSATFTLLAVVYLRQL